jgi:hypothetical protein
MVDDMPKDADRVYESEVEQEEEDLNVELLGGSSLFGKDSPIILRWTAVEMRK